MKRLDRLFIKAKEHLAAQQEKVFCVLIVQTTSGNYTIRYYFQAGEIVGCNNLGLFWSSQEAQLEMQKLPLIDNCHVGIIEYV